MEWRKVGYGSIFLDTVRSSSRRLSCCAPHDTRTSFGLSVIPYIILKLAYLCHPGLSFLGFLSLFTKIRLGPSFRDSMTPLCSPKQSSLHITHPIIRIPSLFLVTFCTVRLGQLGFFELVCLLVHSSARATAPQGVLGVLHGMVQLPGAAFSSFLRVPWS